MLEAKAFWEHTCIAGGLFVCGYNKKSAVLLRRFCLARKMEQWNTIQLSVVLFLSAYNRCADGCTVADKQQNNPQCKVAVVAGLRRLRQLRRYGVGFVDFLGAVFVTVILSAAAAAPILDVALGILGRRLGREML